MFFPIMMLAAAPSSPQVVPVSSAVAAPSETSPDASARLKEAVGAVLRADGKEARRLIGAVPENQLDEEDRRFRSCFMSRLAPPRRALASTAELLPQVLRRYQSYWANALTDAQRRPKLEDGLRSDLAVMLKIEPASSWDEIENALSGQLASSGYHSQLGRTGHLRDFMIWRDETRKDEAVQLPGGNTQTTVLYLDGFVSRGWSSFFTCDRTGTGGWTTDDGLFVVVPAYKSLDDEHFRVNFLAHESQHFVDKVSLPGLKDWELEYRAKLVELALADTTLRRVLEGFAANISQDPSEPHSFANRKVLEAVRRRLEVTDRVDLAGIEPNAVKMAARYELAFDTGRRECAGHGTH